MTTQNTVILNEVRALCAETLRVGIDQVTPQARLLEDLEVDSLFVVQLAIALEEKFSISMPEDDIPTLKTVQQMADYVALKVGEA